MRFVLILRLFILLISFLFSSQVWSECKPAGIHFLPENHRLSSNGVIIVTARLLSQNDLIQLHKHQYRAFLVSKSDTVPVKLLYFNQGFYEENQAILKPNRPLKVGDIYRFAIKDGKNQFVSFDYESQCETYWKISEPKKYSKLNWTQFPELIQKKNRPLGCGNAVYLIYSLCENKGNSSWMQIRFKNETDKMWQNGIVALDSARIYVGHGMCSGLFNLYEGTHCQIQFRKMNEQGDVSPWSPLYSAFIPNQTELLETDRRAPCVEIAQLKKVKGPKMQIIWMISCLFVGLIGLAVLRIILKNRKLK